MSHSSQRIFDLNYIVFPMLPLFTISIYELILKNNPKWKQIILSSVILLLVFISSLYGVLYSPYISRPNVAITYNEVSGMGWLFNYKDDKLILDTQGGIGYRYADLFLGESEKKQGNNRGMKYGGGKTQDHLGYDKNKYFNETNKYIVITTEGELVYETVYKKVGRYNVSDFENFRNDPNVYKIYDSLNIEIYKS